MDISMSASFPHGVGTETELVQVKDIMTDRYLGDQQEHVKGQRGSWRIFWFLNK